MMADLNDMLEADARGEHTQEDFDGSWRSTAICSPRTRATWRSWSTRWPAGPPRPAAARLAHPEQRDELADLMAQTPRRRRAGRRDAPARRARCGPPARPGLERPGADDRRGARWAWATPPRRWRSWPTSPSWRPRCARTTRAPGSTTSTRRRYAARWAARPSTTWRRCAGIERELERQGYLKRRGGKLELTPKAVRRLGETALRRVFSALDGGPPRRPRPARRGPGRRADRRPPAVAVRRRAAHRRRPHAGQRVRRGGVAALGDRAAVRARGRRLRGGGDRAAHAPRRSACWSTCRTRWPCAAPGARPSRPRWRCTRWSRRKYPQDAIQIIGFSNYARVLQPDRAGRARLGHGPGHQPAPRPADRRPAPGPPPRRRAGGPGRHRRRADRAPAARRAAPAFDWPPSPRDAGAHPGRGRQDDPARGRRSTSSCSPTTSGWWPSSTRWPAATAAGCSPRPPDRLGEYVVSDYLRARRAR